MSVAAVADPPAPAVFETDLVLEGSDGQLSFEVGGKRVTSSELKLVGGKLEVEGQFAKGERAVLRVEIEVGEVAFVDSRDGKTGQVVGCARRHKARIVNVSRAESED